MSSINLDFHLLANDRQVARVYSISRSRSSDFPEAAEDYPGLAPVRANNYFVVVADAAAAAAEKNCQ